MIKIGDRAPDFELPDQSGANISLSLLLQNGDLVLYFYPADFTPVCTAEACAFRDVYPELSGIDIQVVGISPQSSESHQRFADRYSLPFPLLFDSGKTVIRKFGVEGPFGFGVHGVTFLIGENREVKNRVISDFFVSSHMQMIQKLLTSK